MENRKINVGILFGGKSVEHEVSLQSAKNVIEAIDKEKYNPILIGIDKGGRWLLNDQSHFLLNAENPSLIKLNASSDAVALLPQSEGEIVNLSHPDIQQSIDVVFPILHGPFGEDGTVQGLLKLAGIPFVGSDVLGSAVGMDKDVMKRLLRDAGIPIARFHTYRDSDIIDFLSVSEELGLPLFVKPANLGSSVGVSKVRNEEEFKEAISQAFEYDRKIIIEECVVGREIECSVLGNDEPIASVPGEVIASADFYSYEAKYIDENGARLEVPANITNEEKETIQVLAIKTFQTLSCAGLGRVDFFLKENGEVLVNEINTMPGFTSISMYPRMWGASGITYPDLIDRLIQLAIERFKIERRLKTSR